jgi:hypothetical protein
VEYDLLITAVSHRAHLFRSTLDSFLRCADQKPRKIIVHEDYRAPEERMKGSECDQKDIKRRLDEADITYCHRYQQPWIGLGKACHWCISRTDLEFCFYMQEDFDFLRPLPVKKTLEIMKEYELNHVRFNKRANTQHARSGFHHKTVEMSGQKLQASEHWHFQAGMWRTSVAKKVFHELVDAAPKNQKPIEWTARAFNRHANQHIFGLKGWPFSADDRIKKAKTLIWGDAGEPAFIAHSGGSLQSQDHARTADWKRPQR